MECLSPHVPNAPWIPIKAATKNGGAFDLPTSVLQKAKLAVVRSSKALLWPGLRSKGRSSWHVANGNTGAWRRLTSWFDKASLPIVVYKHHNRILWCAACGPTPWCNVLTLFSCVAWRLRESTDAPMPLPTHYDTFLTWSSGYTMFAVRVWVITSNCCY